MPSIACAFVPQFGLGRPCTTTPSLGSELQLIWVVFDLAGDSKYTRAFRAPLVSASFGNILNEAALWNV